MAENESEFNKWQEKIDRMVKNVNKFMRIHQEYLKKKGIKNKRRDLSNGVEDLKRYFKKNKWEEE